MVTQEPGDVAGISDATKDHTLVRKAGTSTGNDGYWEFSAGESEDDSVGRPRSK